MKFWLLIVGFFLVLGLTNRWPGFEDGFRYFQAADTRSYMAIAENYSHLSSLNLPIHHFQRLFIPILVGVTEHLTGLSPFYIFRGFALLLCLLIVFASLKILNTKIISDIDRIFLIALLIFNPYVMRYYLAIPVMCEDLLFVFGEVLLLFGLLEKRAGTVLLSLVLALLGRQTALFLLPVTSLWIFFLKPWSSMTLSKKIFWNILYWVILGFLYKGLSFLAKGAGAHPADNVRYLFGMYLWIRDSFDIEMFVLMFARALFPLLSVLVLIAMIAFKSKISFKKFIEGHLEVLMLFIFSLAVIAQPLLGDPTTFLTNMNRYSGQAFIFLWIALVFTIEFVSQKGIASRQKANFVIPLLLVIFASFHHIYSWIGALIYSHFENPTGVYACFYILVVLTANSLFSLRFAL